jgi:hypothetical protein
MTGRVAGYCAGHPAPGFTNPTPGYGRGFGFGRGRGRGFGRGYWGRGIGFWWRGEPYFGPHSYNIGLPPILSKGEEKTYLEDVIKSLEQEMKMIRDRLQELSKEKKETSQ